MTRSEFSVFKKKTINKKGIARFQYCARFFNSDGKIVKTKPLSATTLTTANKEAGLMLEEGGLGILTVDPIVMDLIIDFWRQDSVYALEKKDEGRPLSESYIYINKVIAKKHLSRPLGGIQVSELTLSLMRGIKEK
jgi:hypothetical protein